MEILAKMGISGSALLGLCNAGRSHMEWVLGRSLFSRAVSLLALAVIVGQPAHSTTATLTVKGHIVSAVNTVYTAPFNLGVGSAYTFSVTYTVNSTTVSKMTLSIGQYLIELAPFVSVNNIGAVIGSSWGSCDVSTPCDSSYEFGDTGIDLYAPGSFTLNQLPCQFPPLSVYSFDDFVFWVDLPFGNVGQFWGSIESLSTSGCQGSVTGVDLSVNPTATEWASIINSINPSFVIVDAWGGRSECPGQFIFQCNAPTPAEQILTNAPSGLKKAAYALLNYDTPTQPGATQIGFALDSLGGQYQPGNANATFPFIVNGAPTPWSELACQPGNGDGNLSFMAVDVESAIPGEILPVDPASQTARVQRIYEAVQAVQRAGLSPIIYTHNDASVQDWQTITRNTTSFGCLPLWTAHADGLADLSLDIVPNASSGAPEPWTEVAFGGWSQRAGKQYCVNNTACTIGIGAPDADLDVFNPYLFSAASWGMALDETDANLGANVTVSRSGFRLNHGTNQYVQTVTITNTSACSIPGPVSLALDNLSANATLVAANGATSCTVPAGSSLLNVQQGPLPPGQSVNVTLQFSNPTNQGIVYAPRILAGSGTR